MRTFDDLESEWQAYAPPKQSGVLQYIVLREGGGRHTCVDEAIVDPERGLIGDRWADGPEPNLDAQVTVMNAHVAALLAHDTQPIDAPGDNLLVELDVSEDALPEGATLRIGSAVLRVTAEPHMGCRTFSERFGPDALKWVNWKPHRSRRLRGVNCRVIERGGMAVGDVVTVVAPSSIA